jgi:hypothetical protein
MAEADFTDTRKLYEEVRAENARQARISLVPFEKIKLGTECRYLVKGLIPREGLTVIWGEPKSGKSFWTTDVMLHIALGWDYRGRKVVSGPVIYCAFEGAFGFSARIEAFRQKFLPAKTSKVPFYLQPLTLDLVRDRKELVAAIRATLGKTTIPVAVTLDTLNRSLAGSESKDEDMGAYVRAADEIREAFHCAVPIVHHCGVKGERPRGHTSLTGAAEAQLAVERHADNNIVVLVEHMKDGPEGAAIASRLQTVELGTDEDGEPISSCVVVEAEGAAATKPKKLHGAKAIAGLRALHDCLADQGRLAPPSEHIPAGVQTVTLEEWRHRLDVTGRINREGNPRQEFSRIRVTLSNAGAIGIWEDFVWAVT